MFHDRRLDTGMVVRRNFRHIHAHWDAPFVVLETVN
jgi:hypothetical protein